MFFQIVGPFLGEIFALLTLALWQRVSGLRPFFFSPCHLEHPGVQAHQAVRADAAERQPEGLLHQGQLREQPAAVLPHRTPAPVRQHEERKRVSKYFCAVGPVLTWVDEDAGKYP